MNPNSTHNKKQAAITTENQNGQHSLTITYESALPSPQDLAQYKDILPSIPERYMSLFETQVHHRQEEEKKTHLEFIIEQ